MSDGSVMEFLKGNIDGVGSKVGPIGFSLVDDTSNANFVFTNGDKSTVLEKVNIPTKGFINEIINLEATIEEDQIARVKIWNPSMGDTLTNPPKKVEINRLTFYYDISVLN